VRVRTYLEDGSVVDAKDIDQQWDDWAPSEVPPPPPPPVRAAPPLTDSGTDLSMRACIAPGRHRFPSQASHTHYRQGTSEGFRWK